jgi:hypothetical protein
MILSDLHILQVTGMEKRPMGSVAAYLAVSLLTYSMAYICFAYRVIEVDENGIVYDKYLGWRFNGAVKIYRDYKDVILRSWRVRATTQYEVRIKFDYPNDLVVYGISDKQEADKLVSYFNGQSDQSLKGGES